MPFGVRKIPKRRKPTKFKSVWHETILEAGFFEILIREEFYEISKFDIPIGKIRTGKQIELIAGGDRKSSLIIYPPYPYPPVNLANEIKYIMSVWTKFLEGKK